MLPDRVSNPGLLTYESGALPIALRGPAPASLRIPKCCLFPYLPYLSSKCFLSQVEKCQDSSLDRIYDNHKFKCLGHLISGYVIILPRDNMEDI